MEMIGEVLKDGLKFEFDAELGYSKYDYHNKSMKNSRNGYSRKTLKTNTESVRIAVARDSNGTLKLCSKAKWMADAALDSHLNFRYNVIKALSRAVA